MPDILLGAKLLLKVLAGGKLRVLGVGAIMVGWSRRRKGHAGADACFWHARSGDGEEGGEGGAEEGTPAAEDGYVVRRLRAGLLRDLSIVDTPGTNVILERQQRLTEEFVPRADLVLFTMSAGGPPAKP